MPPSPYSTPTSITAGPGGPWSPFHIMIQYQPDCQTHALTGSYPKPDTEQIKPRIQPIKSLRGLFPPIRRLDLYWFNQWYCRVLVTCSDNWLWCCPAIVGSLNVYIQYEEYNLSVSESEWDAKKYVVSNLLHDVRYISRFDIHHLH